METIYTVCWFIIGICFGSFYHVVGYRLPKGETLLKPKHSYCPNCHTQLTGIDLIPIISFLFGRGKCRYCKEKISWFYPIIELLTGLLFALSFHLFGYSYEFIIAIILSSMLSMITVSDILYLIIPDEIILTGSILIFLTTFIFKGWKVAFLGIGNGCVMFLAMYLLMLFGNFLFRKETLGGADIKLMFTSGLTVGPFLSLCVIFLSSVIALPIAIIIYVINKEHIIPYGPFIALALLIIFLSQIDISTVANFLFPVV